MQSSDPAPGYIAFSIVSIKQETDAARTYTLQARDGGVPDFIPGQFLTFLITIDGHELRRSFSIVSLPGERLRISVKKVENGAVSRYILEHWSVDDKVESLPPAGRFVLPASTTVRDIYFIVAGSGIAPALPQIRYLLRAEPHSLIHLVYSNHSEPDTLFREEIAALKAENLQLNVYDFISEPVNPLHHHRRLNNGVLEVLVGRTLAFRPKDAVFMICGPFTFMRMVRITLIFMHFSDEQIRKENFLPGIMRASPERADEFPERTIQLSYSGNQYVLPVRKNQSILRAALEHGIPLPYSCEGGACSVCAAKCLRGKVELTINEVLTDKDLVDGWVLTCTGHPVTDDVMLSFPPSILPVTI